MESLAEAMKPVLEKLKDMGYNGDTTLDSDLEGLTADNLSVQTSRDALREPSLSSGVVIGVEEK